MLGTGATILACIRRAIYQDMCYTMYQVMRYGKNQDIRYTIYTVTRHTDYAGLEID